MHSVRLDPYSGLWGIAHYVFHVEADLLQGHSVIKVTQSTAGSHKGMDGIVEPGEESPHRIIDGSNHIFFGQKFATLLV